MNKQTMGKEIKATITTNLLKNKRPGTYVFCNELYQFFKEDHVPVFLINFKLKRRGFHFRNLECFIICKISVKYY